MVDNRSSVEFQRETWTSIKLSLMAAKIVKTSGYEKWKAEILRDRPLNKDSIEHAEAMIISAAHGMPVKVSDGRAIFITPERINNTVSNQEFPVLTWFGSQATLELGW